MVERKTTEDLISERPSIEDLKTLDRFPIYIILDNVRSLENVGLIFRLADALRTKKLFLTGITGYPPMGPDDPRSSNVQEHAFNQIAKTGIKLVPFVDWAYVEKVTDVIKKMKEEGIQIVSVEQTHGSKDYREINYNFPVALIFGHEREGVGDEVLNLSDEIIDIPMYGLGNSLNIATSVAIVGYELANRFNSK